jgi:hypothetical protein
MCYFNEAHWYGNAGHFVNITRIFSNIYVQIAAFPYLYMNRPGGFDFVKIISSAKLRRFQEITEEKHKDTQKIDENGFEGFLKSIRRYR